MNRSLFYFLVFGGLPLFYSSSVFALGEIDDTPVTHEEIIDSIELSDSRPWRAPSFRGQELSLGYQNQGFEVPAAMEDQVLFWRNIYTKYSTSQGVIHDAEEINFIYEVLDFRDIEKRKDLTLYEIDKLKKKRVDEAKQRAEERWRKAINANSASELSSRDRDLWKKRHELSPQRLRFQLGQKDRMEKAIFLSGRYIEDFENIFRENHLPIELTRLVFVESSFNVLARSKVGASGLWQIMPFTARPYGMMNTAVDKRNHPLEATKLAARLLKMNYEILQSWPLAITGYNHGPTGVLKMTKKYRTRDLPELIANVRSRKSFGFASRNFYASFLAALEVEKNASKYFPKIRWSQRLPSQPLKLPVALHYQELLEWFGGDEAQAQIFNPHLNRRVITGHQHLPAKTWVNVPENQFTKILVSVVRKQRESRSPLLSKQVKPSRRSTASAR